MGHAQLFVFFGVVIAVFVLALTATGHSIFNKRS